jgi:AcrR family transcriptional regulator
MRSRPSPRAPLSRDAIVEAALRVLDAEGMEGLSMRRLGEELGTGAASLYWHVRGKEELFQLIFERVTAEVRIPEPDPTRWREQLAELCQQMRGVLTRHRDVARLSLGRTPAGGALAAYREWLFALLQPVGMPDSVIARLAGLLGLYVGAYAVEESLGASSPPGAEMPGERLAFGVEMILRGLATYAGGCAVGEERVPAPGPEYRPEQGRPA